MLLACKTKPLQQQALQTLLHFYPDYVIVIRKHYKYAMHTVCAGKHKFENRANEHSLQETESETACSLGAKWKHKHWPCVHHASSTPV